MASLDDRITDLAAKVTALIMLLEGLYADELAKTDDPAKIGDLMVQGVLKEEQKIGEFFAGDEATAALRSPDFRGGFVADRSRCSKSCCASEIERTAPLLIQ